MPAAEAAATALLLIDFQKGFLDPFWGARNNPQAEDNALRLIAAFRQHGVPVLHVRHLSRTPGSPLSGRGTDFKDGFTPAAGEALFEKSVNSAFIGTDLEAKLRAQGITRLVICGLTDAALRLHHDAHGRQSGLRGDARCTTPARRLRATPTSASTTGRPMAPTRSTARRWPHLHNEFANGRGDGGGAERRLSA